VYIVLTKKGNDGFVQSQLPYINERGVLLRSGGLGKT